MEEKQSCCALSLIITGKMRMGWDGMGWEEDSTMSLSDATLMHDNATPRRDTRLSWLACNCPTSQLALVSGGRIHAEEPDLDIDLQDTLHRVHCFSRHLGSRTSSSNQGLHLTRG